MTRTNILGIQIDALTIKQANLKIAALVKTRSRAQTALVVKPYVEFLVAAQKDPKLADILNSADLCLADGVSLQWAASYLYGQPNKKLLKVPRSGLVWLQKPAWRNQVLPEKMAGANQTRELLAMAKKHNWRVGILGGRNTPGEIKRAIEDRFQITSLNVWSGFFSKEQEVQLVASIAAAKLDILFVAMGFPLQELFMQSHISDGLARVMIGEGGTFDYEEMGGPVKRAPVWMQKGGVEWAWRLLRQPKRLKRQLSIPQFVFQIKRQSKKL